MKYGIDNLTKSSIAELSQGLLIMFQDVLGELIAESRQHRNMNFLMNSQRITNYQGQEKHITV